MPPKTLELEEKYNISIARHFFEGTLASTHPLDDGPIEDLVNLLNVNVRAGATTFFPFGEEEKGEEHNVSLVMAQMDLYMLFSGVRLECSRKGNLFLEYRCPNLCCSGAVIFQLIVDGKYKVPFDKRFGRCVFRQGVEHELSCFNFVPLPQMPMRFEEMSTVMIHVVAIRAVLKNYGAKFSEDLGEKVIGFLGRTFSKVWKMSYAAKRQIKRILDGDGSYFRSDKTGKLDSLNLTRCSNFHFLHMLVGKHLSSKRPSAAEPHEFEFFDHAFPNLTFPSRYCSNTAVCHICMYRLGEDADGHLVVPRVHVKYHFTFITFSNMNYVGLIYFSAMSECGVPRKDFLTVLGSISSEIIGHAPPLPPREA